MAAERTAHLRAVIEHAPRTRSLMLELDAPLAFRPGQFVSCLVPRGRGDLNRPYSIASSAEERTRIELLVDLVPGGPGSTYLFDRRPGDVLRFTGPWGTFVLDEPPDAELVFVAAETGIAPIRPMLLRAAGRARRPLTLLYGTALGLYARELGALPGVTLTTVPPEIVFDEAVARLVDADVDRTRHVWICGVGERVYRLRDRLRAAGYARRAVQYEKW